MTYHLRRLRLHGIVERIPQTHRYRITDFGLRTAWFCTRIYSRDVMRQTSIIEAVDHRQQ
jgi:hypothetical protein